MNAVMYEQTAAYLTRRVRNWDRRLRVTTSAIWGPRGIMLGLVTGVVIAAVARTRAWLFPEQIALITVVAVSVGFFGALAAIWLWPRSAAHQARYFDRQFDLKERVSTAMEIVAGSIPFPDGLAEHQLADTVTHADHVNVKARLPLRVKALEILVLVLLGVLLAFLLLAHNRYTEELKTRHQLQQAINNQAAALQQTAEQIQENSSLSPEEQEALTQPLDEAREILQQPDVSQQEAVAALAEASQKLSDMQEGMTPDEQQAYQNAASELADSEMTANLAQALEKGDLGQTADELNDLSDDLKESELSETQQQDLAEKLDSAAEQLDNVNPALAQKLREAADALRNGDTQAAQKALNEAADLAREQQKQLENSPMADAARQAQEQMQQSQREMAEAGREQSQQQAQASEQQGQQQSQSTSGQSQSQQAQGQPTGEQSQTSEQFMSEQQAAGQQTQGEQSQQSAAGSSQQGDQAGEGQQAQAPSEGDQSAIAGQEASQDSAQSQGQSGGSAGDAEQESSQGAAAGQQTSEQGAIAGQSPSSDGQAALGAGEGQGGAGHDTTSGVMAEAGSGEISTNNSPEEEGLQDYNPAYDPSTIGGQSEDVINVGGQSSGSEGEPVEQGEFGDNPTGESALSYTSVFGNYRDIVSEALDSGRIPLDQRDVIHDYFASIAR